MLMVNIKLNQKIFPTANYRYKSYLDTSGLCINLTYSLYITYGYMLISMCTNMIIFHNRMKDNIFSENAKIMVVYFKITNFLKYATPRKLLHLIQ